MVRTASMEYENSQEANKKPYNDIEVNQRTRLLDAGNRDERTIQEVNMQNDQLALNKAHEQQPDTWYNNMIGVLKELMTLPTIGAVLGLIFGTIPRFHHLIVGDHAWLRVIPDCAKLLGCNTIPCITLIMGGNLIEGTTAKLFDVGQKECALLFLWTYVGDAFALTIWCTIYMWILS